MNGTLCTKSKFNGNSGGTILEGYADLKLMKTDETYRITFPNFWVKNIFFGTLCMEIGGDCTIKCEKTNLVAEIEFKQKPMMGGESGVLTGKVFTYVQQTNKQTNKHTYIHTYIRTCRQMFFNYSILF